MTLTFNSAADLARALEGVQALHEMSAELIAERVFELAGEKVIPAGLVERRRAGFEAYIIGMVLEGCDDEYSNSLEQECRDVVLRRLEGSQDYFELDTQKRWLAWNAALDSIEIELPKIDISLSTGHSDAFCEGVLYAQRMDREALVAAGFEVAP